MHDTQTNTTTNIPKTKRTPYGNETIPNRTNLRPGYKRTNRTASNNIPPTHTTDTAHTANDLNELKQIMTNLLDQMETLINLITVLINKNI